MREEVQWFAELMNQELDENIEKEQPGDGSPGRWEHKSLDYLLERLQEEVDELAPYLPHKCLQCDDEHFPSWVDNEGEECPIDEIVKECCDIANFAMMIADNIQKGRHIDGEPVED